ncbi:NAD-dependent epimerase/dehydratase family protein [Nitrosopumilus sp.]|uniref:NAD-dependent epimerase/dehydratase family protein n=1 Tax=Nitrosopumilus sp. TaxID=2024843 RepID=UPI0029311B77|nr:NAD-dependent epimerase/dehydratase family protein [Nitrosopumilus sp.]
MVRTNQVVVIGASGFVAKNLRKYLSEKNIKLISISRSNFKQFKNETKIVLKKYDEKYILPKIQNSTALFHLVGIGKQSVKINFDMINVQFTDFIINMSKKAKIKKIIYASGLGVNANSSNEYFISKYRAEQLIINSGLDYSIFRPSYIVGKDDLFTKSLKNQIKKGEINIPGSGLYSIQPIYIGDVVKLFFQSITQKEFQNKILDLVGPDLLTFEQYVKLFSKKTTASIKKFSLEEAYHDAITNSKSLFGIDDLNILIGNFKGNHNKLQKLSKIKFHSILELLNSGRLL